MDILLLFSMLFEANFVCIILFFSGIFFICVKFWRQREIHL